MIFHRFDQNGRYTNTVESTEEGITFEDPATIYIGDANPATQYHDLQTNKPVDMPPKPSEFHWFNYETKAWELQYQYAAEVTKGIRNRLLNQSDWTQLPDVPLATKEAWAIYRQALRNITNQAGFPTQVEWPTKPS